MDPDNASVTLPLKILCNFLVHLRNPREATSELRWKSSQTPWNASGNPLENPLESPVTHLKPTETPGNAPVTPLKVAENLLKLLRMPSKLSLYRVWNALKILLPAMFPKPHWNPLETRVTHLRSPKTPQNAHETPLKPDKNPLRQHWNASEILMKPRQILCNATETLRNFCKNPCNASKTHRKPFETFCIASDNSLKPTRIPGNV